MKTALSTVLVLGLTAATAVSAAIITVPLDYLEFPEHRNPESLTKRYFQKRAALSTNIPLTNVENDVIYTVPVGLGTPAQNFNVAIDTGSPVTWVSLTTCTSTGCASVNKFNCAASSTCQAAGQNFSANYVSGQGVSGDYYIEEYTLGQLNFQAVMGGVTVNSAPLPTGVDGIMGLWFYGPGSNIPILNRLYNTTALTQNMIGIYLTPSTSTSNTAPGGEITFGGVDTTRFQGQISYTNCVSSRPWTIPVAAMKVGSTNIAVGTSVAAIDTGTTAMLMPKAVSDQINQAIPGAQLANTQSGPLWLIPCSGNTVTTITFGSFTASIPYTSLAMQSTKTATTQGDFCVSAAMFPSGTTATIDAWLIGDAFLKNVYSVFDFGTNTATGGRIGFAALGSGGSTVPATGSNGNSNNNNNSNASSAAKNLRSITALQAIAVVAVAASVCLAGL